MTKNKVGLGKILIFLLCILCVGMDVWWFTIYKYSPDKVTSNTINVTELTTADGSVTRDFIELNYYTNANQNGYEMFEIKFNYFTDENHETIFSQGLQFVANAETAEIEWEYLKDSSQSKGVFLNGKAGWYDGQSNYGFMGGYKPLEETTTSYNYQSLNDYKTTLISTNELVNDSKFKITLNGENFLMSFKGNNTDMTPENFEYKEKGDYHFYLVYGSQDINYYYSYFDAQYFAQLLYKSIQTLPAGTSETTVFEFGDIFNYYKESDISNVYETIAADESTSSKIINDIKSYYGIKINVSADGVRSSNDSMFNVVAGNSNFNLTGDYIDDTYFYGRTMINVSIYDFELVKIDDIYYALKLKDEFLKEYLQYRGKISLNVDIDTTIEEVKDLEFIGFTKDSGLDYFNIYKTNIKGVGNV